MVQDMGSEGREMTQSGVPASALSDFETPAVLLPSPSDPRTATDVSSHDVSIPRRHRGRRSEGGSWNALRVGVITSYSIHYTKLYEFRLVFNESANAWQAVPECARAATAVAARRALRILRRPAFGITSSRRGVARARLNRRDER